MKFRFNSVTKIVECEATGTYLKCLWQMPESGLEFLLVWRGRKIGFRTADLPQDNKSERLPDGTQIWRFDRVFCKILRPDREHGGTATLTDTYSLGTIEEVRQALDILRETLVVLDAAYERKSGPHPKAQVEFSEHVHRQVQEGAFVS